jgi:hypothetical protein
LHRWLVALFDNGVGFVTTSNFEPNGLYPDGLPRDRILPAIALLNERMRVLNVDNGTDYRRRTLEMVKLYHSPLGEQAEREMNEAFNRLATGPDEDPVLHIEAREITAVCALAGQPAAAGKYIQARKPLAQVRADGATLRPELATVVVAADDSVTARLDLAPEGIAEELAEVLRETSSAQVVQGFDPTRHTFRLTSRRLKSVFNSSGRELDVLRRREGTNFAHMHPDDLAALGATDGGQVEVASPRGTIRAVVKAAADVRPGSVSMAHAWGGLPDDPSPLSEFGSTTAALIDADSGYDRFTGMPVMSAIPVAVRAVG